MLAEDWRVFSLNLASDADPHTQSQETEDEINTVNQILLLDHEETRSGSAAVEYNSSDLAVGIAKNEPFSQETATRGSLRCRLRRKLLFDRGRALRSLESCR